MSSHMCCVMLECLLPSIIPMSFFCLTFDVGLVVCRQFQAVFFAASVERLPDFSARTPHKPPVVSQPPAASSQLPLVAGIQS